MTAPEPTTAAPSALRARALTRRELALAVVIALLGLVLGALRAAPGVVGAYHDDGIYVASAEALAAGEGYVLPFLPDPLPQTKYPIGLPALFAVIWLLAPDFPANAVLFQALCLVLLASGNALCALFAIRFGYASPRAAFVSAGLAATSAGFLNAGTLPLSEGPFLLLGVLALWVVEAALGDATRVRSRAALAGALLAAVVLVRTMGLPWIAVAALFFLWRRRAGFWPFVLCALPPVVLWMLWSTLARPGEVPPLFAYYVDYAADWTGAGIGDIPAIAATNLYWLLLGFGALWLPGPYTVWYATLPPLTWLWSSIALPLVVRSLRLVARGRLLPWVGAAYFFPVVVHPWPPYRFWVPLVSLGGALCLAELGAAWRRGWRRRPRAARPLALVLVAVAAVLNLGYLALVHFDTREHGYPTGVPGREYPHWSALEQGFAWIRSHTEPDAIVASGRDPMVWLYTRRRSFRFYEQKPAAMFYGTQGDGVVGPQGLLRNLRLGRADFVLDGPLYNDAISGDLRGHLQSLAEGEGAPLSVVFESQDGSVRIYRVEARAEP